MDDGGSTVARAHNTKNCQFIIGIYEQCIDNVVIFNLDM